jgi:transcriptional regulator with XRE-family HTH domain
MIFLKGGDYMIHERIKQVRKSLPQKTSQEAFGKILGVSRDAISNIELGRVPPTNPFIQLLCLKFDINEHWLRTGEGDMMHKLDRDEEITIWAAKLMQKDESDFPKKFASLLSKLDENEWKELEKIAMKLFNDQQNKKD